MGVGGAGAGTEAETAGASASHERTTDGRGRVGTREEGADGDGYLFFAPLHDQRMRDGGQGEVFSLHRSVDRMLRFMPFGP